jgi:hypothetical protein
MLAWLPSAAERERERKKAEIVNTGMKQGTFL